MLVIDLPNSTLTNLSQSEKASSPIILTESGTTMLSMKEFLIAITCAIAIVPIVELQKLIELGIRKSKQKKINAYQEEQKTETEEQM